MSGKNSAIQDKKETITPTDEELKDWIVFYKEEEKLSFKKVTDFLNEQSYTYKGRKLTKSTVFRIYQEKKGIKPKVVKKVEKPTKEIKDTQKDIKELVSPTEIKGPRIVKLDGSIAPLSNQDLDTLKNLFKVEVEEKMQSNRTTNNRPRTAKEMVQYLKKRG